MIFQTEVISATWDERKSEWHVRLRRTDGTGEAVEFDDHCNVLILGTGVLNNIKMPDIDGIDSFRGRLLHTARFDQTYQEEQWSKETVAVVGSGSTSLQVVTAMQPQVKKMEVFVRSPIWFGFVGGNFGDNKVSFTRVMNIVQGAYLDDSQSYSVEEKAMFRRDPHALVGHAKVREPH